MRIVSLLPSATEILFGIGAGSSVVGITHECDFPPQAQHLPRLTSSALPSAGSSAEIDRHVRRSVHEGSSLYHLDAEKLEELQPDLIVTQELCKVCAVSYELVDTAARRLKSDPRIVSLEPHSLEDVYANIMTLGELTAHEDGAARLVANLRRRERALRSRVAGLPKLRVLLLEWTDPPMTAGHWIPDLIEGAGGVPVLANPRANSLATDFDAIDAADPDVIVIAPCGFDLERSRDCARELSAHAKWNALRAVRSASVACVDGNAYASRPGPRLIDTMEIFAKIFHG